MYICTHRREHVELSKITFVLESLPPFISYLFSIFTYIFILCSVPPYLFNFDSRLFTENHYLWIFVKYLPFLFQTVVSNQNHL